MLDYTSSGGHASLGGTYTRDRGATSLSDVARNVFVQVTSHITVAPSISPEIRDEFRKHEKKWKRDTRFVSSLSEKYLHPSYARIIGMGRPVLPHILRSLQREPDDWFYALRAITGTNVVPMSAAGNMEEMSRRWIEWGKHRQLV